MIVFASTNDSVQFHETVLTTFLNRKFNMYLDGEDENDLEDMSDYDETDQHNNNDDEYVDEREPLANKPSRKSKAAARIAAKPNRICDLFALYGNMDQHKRAEILAKFCKASSGVLICTVLIYTRKITTLKFHLCFLFQHSSSTIEQDVAARGLDMPNIDWIVQYNTPGTCVDYVHRVGRTARSGHKGKALIFLEPCEVAYLDELTKIGIALREIKLDTVMECLNEESNHYPRQVNSDRVK